MEGQGEIQSELDALKDGFTDTMDDAMATMWSSKLGLPRVEDSVVQELLQLLVDSRADYTILFRRLSEGATDAAMLRDAFYVPGSEELQQRWNMWLAHWREQLIAVGDLDSALSGMRKVNPAITWREWLIAPAYQRAAEGNADLLKELQEIFSRPYDRPEHRLAATYDQRKPRQFFNAGGVSLSLIHI